MISFISGLALICDLSGTVLVIADTVKSRKDAARIANIRNFNEAIEATTRGFENMAAEAEPGPYIGGMSSRDIAALTMNAAKDAIAANKKQIAKILDEIDKSNRIPLTYIASCLLLLGVLLHGVEALRKREIDPATSSQVTAPSQTASSQTIPVDKFKENKIPRVGFNLYYRTAGTGHPVLILSGGPGDDCDYMAPVALEVAKFEQAILLEQRGTGRSMPPVLDKATINLAVYLEDIEALRVQLKVERWTLVGHSAGGLLAMYYAAAYPSRVDKLVLLDSAPIASEFLGPLQANILDRLSAEERDRLAALEKSSASNAEAEMAQINAMALFFDRQIGAQVAATMGNSWHAEVGRLLGNEISAPGYDLRARLKDFDRPVLVLNGRQDPMDPLMAHETSSAFKNSTLRFINRAGHMPWFEQPKQFADAIDDFLK